MNKLQGYHIAAMNRETVLECIMECKKYGGCDSVDYEKNEKFCQLNRHTNGYAIESLVFDGSAWNHWEVCYAYFGYIYILSSSKVVLNSQN